MKFNFESKFEAGDEVWLLVNGKVELDKIKNMSGGYNIDRNINKNNDSIDIRYSLVRTRCNYSECHVYRTKEDLLMAIGA